MSYNVEIIELDNNIKCLRFIDAKPEETQIESSSPCNLNYSSVKLREISSPVNLTPCNISDELYHIEPNN